MTERTEKITEDMPEGTYQLLITFKGKHAHSVTQTMKFNEDTDDETQLFAESLTAGIRFYLKHHPEMLCEVGDMLIDNEEMSELIRERFKEEHPELYEKGTVH